MTSEKPIATADEVFAINKKIRWVGLVTEKGDILINQMRQGVHSYSPSKFDDEFLALGPLTLLGVAERYSHYMQGVEMMIVQYGLVTEIYSRLGSQIIDITIEKDDQKALSEVKAWLEQKKLEIAKIGN